MSSRTREALLGSIAKWEAIVEGEGVDLNTENCQLCKRFRTGDCTISYKPHSEVCPAARGAEHRGCSDTPYEDWTVHHDKVHHGAYPLRVRCEVCTDLAQRELNFLRALLPEEVMV